MEVSIEVLEDRALISIFPRHHKPVPTPPPAPTPAPTPAPPTPTVYTPTISILNSSTVLTDAAIEPMVAAIQVAIDTAFGPVWGVGATLQFLPAGSTPPPASWVMEILDNSDQPGALGYHTLTPAGHPYGKVFAATDIQYGSSFSVTLSHEVFEMLGDSGVDLSVLSADGSKSYAYEACDPCESDSLGFQVQGVLISDFIYPLQYFAQTPGTQFDHTHGLTAPFQVAPGGYQSVFQNGSWTQITNGQLSPRSKSMLAANGS